MRKLASIQTIKYVKPIPDADNIEAVGVLGWEVVSKKGEFKPGDVCVFFEIDSLLPEIPEFEFLRKSCWNENLKKHRLKTVKLRKQLSQGLALPLAVFPNLLDSISPGLFGEKLLVGTDVTDLLGVEKYDPPIPAEIAGDAKRFSWPISKTDETRVQLDDECNFIKSLSGKPYYISLKLDGTSSSFLIHPSDETYHVCGRNFSYKESDDHSFWKLSRKYKIEEGLRHLWKKGHRIAIQGECVGPGIQKNPLGLSCPDLYIFNVVDVVTKQKLCLDQSLMFAEQLGLNFVPVIEQGESFNYTKDDLLEKARLKYNAFFDSAKPSQDAEGIVVRSFCGEISFKAINNDFLLKD
jgi:RNA ligase (TIGR02306 family)